MIVSGLRAALHTRFGQLRLRGSMVLRERLCSLGLHHLSRRGRLVHAARVRATTAFQEGTATSVAALVVLAEIGHLLSLCAGSLELLMRLDVVVLRNQMRRLRLLRWCDTPAVRG